MAETVRTETELLDLFKDNITQDIYPVDVRDFVATMYNEFSLVAGNFSFMYIAYADDDIGTGFTLTFDSAKEYIAVLSTDIEIITPVVGDFAGLWKKYLGDDGPIGLSLLTGVVDPLPGDGVDGDTFLNVSTWDIFGPKSGGVWGSGSNIIGNGIDSIVLQASVPPVDTYRITFTDATTFDYDITNGIDGNPGATGPEGPSQDGVNLGLLTSKHIFKQLDGSSDMEFRSVSTLNIGNLPIVETATDVDIDFMYDERAIIVSSLNGSFSTSTGSNESLNIFEYYDRRFVKFSGGIAYTGLGMSFLTGTLLFDTSLVLSRPTYGTGLIVNGSGDVVDRIGIRIETNGNVRNAETLSIGAGGYLSFNDIRLFK